MTFRRLHGSRWEKEALTKPVSRDAILILVVVVCVLAAILLMYLGFSGAFGQHPASSGCHR